MRLRFIKPFFISIILLVAGSLLPIRNAYATHLRAGEITVERLNCTSLTFRITITAYTNTGSPIQFGEGDLDFGDGSRPVKTETTPNTQRPDLGPNVGIVVYSTTHTFPGAGSYTISYLEANRNGGILNMFNSVDTKFYLETVITIDPFLGCDNSPRLLVPPIDKACTGAAFYHNPGAYDPDGDSLSYEFVTPKQAKNQNVNNFRMPDAREFYDRIGIDYGNANETADGTPDITIDSQTGTIEWNAPGAPGEYNIAFLIKQWRKFGGVWRMIGFVTRDMQIVVEDCNNKRPELEVPEDICVEAGEEVNVDIFGFDPDSDSVKLEAFSEVFNIQSPAIWMPNPARFQRSTPTTPAILKFTWKTVCEHIKDQPYQVVFKISDKPRQGPSLVQFKTWNIRVVGPAPKWTDATLDLNARAANLKWDTYKCQSAERMQVWRRVDKFEFTPPECVTGMPDFLGFTLIAQVPITQSTYRDTNNGRGLAAGAQYCYRLVAVFPLPGGGESYVSKDTCLAPILADAPVITNVTVDRTSVNAGQITVKWRSPFDINKAQFPPPYRYEVYRAEGFSGGTKVKAHPGQLTDPTFIDAGINTEEKVFNYYVVCYDKDNTKVDTSFTASSVRLETQSELEQIQLSWNFDVPWSNRTDKYPRHLIYRSAAGVPEAQMELIDSINVNERTFAYVDSGQYKSTPLKEAETYCYRVMTRGAYGNPKIGEPLINFSQIICAQTGDEDPPCAPIIKAEGLNCESFIQSSGCNPTTFSNLLKWNKPTDEICRADTRGYRVYVIPEFNSEEKTLIADNVRDTFYIDTNIPSYARCYKVSAIDQSGNESDLSEAFCFDNCPHYELPNVFTPNGDKCNELFSAYSDRAVIDETGSDGCGPVDLVDQKRRCARFVQNVRFTVVNRWGTPVYEYESGGERSIYIDWNGDDSNGKQLATGVYYYVAEVTFDVVNPDQRNQTIRGWVHLIR